MYKFTARSRVTHCDRHATRARLAAVRAGGSRPSGGSRVLSSALPATTSVLPHVRCGRRHAPRGEYCVDLGARSAPSAAQAARRGVQGPHGRQATRRRRAVLRGALLAPRGRRRRCACRRGPALVQLTHAPPLPPLAAAAPPQVGGLRSVRLGKQPCGPQLFPPRRRPPPRPRSRPAAASRIGIHEASQPSPRAARTAAPCEAGTLAERSGLQRRG